MTEHDAINPAPPSPAGPGFGPSQRQVLIAAGNILGSLLLPRNKERSGTPS